MNIDFLKKILTTDAQYWIAARKENISEHSVWIICVPVDKFPTGQSINDLLLRDIEALATCEVQNICLSDRFAPFQMGLTMNSFFDGYPIGEDVKDFVVKCLNHTGKRLWDYKALWDEHVSKPLPI